MPEISSPTGVLGDPRLDPLVQNGWKADELLPSAGGIEWKFKPEDQRKKYTIWNQNGSGMCVAFSKAKQLSIEVFRLTGVWIDFSPVSIYQLRLNAPNMGMGISDANDIVNKKGATLDALMKSQNISEAQAALVRRTKVADLFAAAIAEAVVSYVYVKIQPDPIASMLEQGRAVSFLIFANFNEYNDTPTILLPNLKYEDAQIRHEIVAVDYYMHPQFGKCFWIEDSWGVGNGIGGRRTFTEAFLMKRVILADCLAIFDFEGGAGVKPSYDGSVISLQKCLRYEGFFPADVEFTENFGPVTKAAVVKFQTKYAITPALGNVGPITRAKLYQLYT